MKGRVTYVAVPCEAELVAAIDAARAKTGMHRGPEVAQRLRRMFKIGPFAKAAAKSEGGVE